MFAASAALLAAGFPHLPHAAADNSVTIKFEGVGAIQIKLRPDLSSESAAFMREAAEASCGGELYRSESFLMQGRITCRHAMGTVVKKGPCPAGTPTDQHRACPSHDPQWWRLRRFRKHPQLPTRMNLRAWLSTAPRWQRLPRPDHDARDGGLGRREQRARLLRLHWARPGDALVRAPSPHCSEPAIER